jgi:hypothetical protein
MTSLFKNTENQPGQQFHQVQYKTIEPNQNKIYVQTVVDRHIPNAYPYI